MIKKTFARGSHVKFNLLHKLNFASLGVISLMFDNIISAVYYGNKIDLVSFCQGGGSHGTGITYG